MLSLKCCYFAGFSNPAQVSSCNGLRKVPICGLTSKKNCSLYVFSYNVISFPAASCFYKAVCHLEPGVFAPSSNKKTSLDREPPA